MVFGDTAVGGLFGYGAIPDVFQVLKERGRRYLAASAFEGGVGDQ